MRFVLSVLAALVLAYALHAMLAPVAYTIASALEFRLPEDRAGRPVDQR